MNHSARSIRAYVGLSMVSIVLLAALAISTVLTAGLSVYYSATADRVTPAKFDTLKSAENDYVWFDAVGVSDWLYNTKQTSNSTVTENTYYAAEDADGNLIIARISSTEYEKLSAQRTYWDREDNTAPMPEPYRMLGISIPMSNVPKLASSLVQATGLKAGSEFRQYFGSSYLSVGTNPRQKISGMCEGIAILCGMFAVILFFCYRDCIRKTSKSIKVLEEKGLVDAAAEQLSNKTRGQKVVLGNGFLFVKRGGVAISYDSITEASCIGNTVKLKTPFTGETKLKMSSNEAAAEFMSELPLEDAPAEQVITRKKAE